MMTCYIRSRNLLPLHRMGFSLICAMLFVTMSLGCSLSKFKLRQASVFEPDVTKTQVVNYINRNVIGTDSTPGISSWKTSDAKVQVTGIPFPLPASMAVEAPRNLRIVVTHPISGAQEVDMGSNQEGFWVWTKEQTEMITCSHEDTSLALQHFEMPIQIQPEWLMEVFGVTPVDGAEYELQRPKTDLPVIDLVATRTTPTGKHVERVIRVNTYTGNVDEHILREQNGETIAVATLDKYREMPNGTMLPTFVRITWPAAETVMKISLGHPEVNPPSFAGTHGMWNQPQIPGTKVVDIGKLSRQAYGKKPSTKMAQADGSEFPGIRQLQHDSAPSIDRVSFPESPGKVALNPTDRLEAPKPAGHKDTLGSGARSFPIAIDPEEPKVIPMPANDLPEWAQEQTTRKPVTLPVEWQPSTYSPTTWRSSSGQLPQGLE